MADALRKPLDEGPVVEPAPTTPLPGTPPAVDEREGHRMKRESQPTLVNAAESVGSAIGSAVGTIKNTVQSGLELVKERSAGPKENLSEVAATVRERTSGLTDSVRQQADEFADKARDRIHEWSSVAQRRVGDLRRRGAELSRERPLETVFAIAGIAFFAGLILRLWRSSRD